MRVNLTQSVDLPTGCGEVAPRPARSAPRHPPTGPSKDVAGERPPGADRRAGGPVPAGTRPVGRSATDGPGRHRRRARRRGPGPRRAALTPPRRRCGPTTRDWSADRRARSGPGRERCPWPGCRRRTRRVRCRGATHPGPADQPARRARTSTARHGWYSTARSSRSSTTERVTPPASSRASDWGTGAVSTVASAWMGCPVGDLRPPTRPGGGERRQPAPGAHVEIAREVLRHRGHARGAAPAHVAVGVHRSVGQQPSVEPGHRHAGVTPLLGQRGQLLAGHGEELGAVVEHGLPDAAGGHAASDAPALVDDDHRPAGAGQGGGGREPGDAGPDDQHLGVGVGHSVRATPTGHDSPVPPSPQ